MSYITQKELDDRMDLPIALPVTELKPNSWLIASVYQIQQPMQLTFRFLQLQLLSVEVTGGQAGDTETEFSSDLLDQAKGLVYAAILPDYSGQSPYGLASIGTLNDIIIADKVGIFSRATENPLIVKGTNIPKHYSVILVNNTSNTIAKALLNGQMRLDLNAS